MYKLLVPLALTLSISLVAPYLLYYSYIRRHSRRIPHHTPRRGSIKVSVLVCTLNAADVIEKKFRDVLNQNYPLSDLELIVVDGGSTDGTYEMTNRIKGKLSGTLKITLIKSRTAGGKAAQINEGLRAAKREFVITTDSDVEMDPDAIKVLVDSLSSHTVGAVCARQVIRNPHQSMVTETEATYRRYYEVLRIGESNLYSTPIFHGGLSGFRREAVSLISEDVNADDTQLALSAIRSGFRAIYEPRSIFYVKSPSDILEGWRQRVRRGQGLQRVFWRNRDMVFARRLGRFGVPVFPAEFYMHNVSPILLAIIGAPLLGLLVSSLTPFIILAGFGLTGFFLLKRDSFPIRFLLSFVLYQLALFWAIVLHLMGHNYRRWSKRETHF